MLVLQAVEEMYESIKGEVETLQKALQVSAYSPPTPPYPPSTRPYRPHRGRPLLRGEPQPLPNCTSLHSRSIRSYFHFVLPTE